MKRLLIIILSGFLTLGLYYCSPRVSPSSEVNFLSEQEGTITVSAVGYGKTEAQAFDNAEIAAINAILFRGVPGSGQKTALIGTNESEIENKYSDYFKDFYTNSRFKTFIISIIPTTDLKKVGGGIKTLSAQVTVNLRALRNDLVEMNVIRKFGF